MIAIIVLQCVCVCKEKVRGASFMVHRADRATYSSGSEEVTMQVCFAQRLMCGDVLLL